eukprot:Plantae.Rhodophyta-Rhodochaete_pulchella.ctg14724.p1 GENE.Plantae.Rhodophyta-Rhodochaete_pulchella.ctg14724~~Plantae.Rhodophyta-Rhodochaete_pulchella.ctg14724.p1  ORF type:complete len:276 (-),score=27.22 Plantae.Rhodophyta-Rhodochaete_pulchella.ctg14724:38-793(-)
MYEYGKGTVASEEGAPVVEATDSPLVMHAFSNPTSPKGSQHCFELDVPGGTSSPFWAAKSWHYPNPPWYTGACDRSEFAYVNKVTPNLDNYTGVSLTEYGKGASESPRLRGSEPNSLHASCKLQWTFPSTQCSAASSTIVTAAQKMAGFDSCASSEKCGYVVGTYNASYFEGKHETPVKHYKDDLTISFSDSGSGCVAHGYSTSEIWYAVLDDGTNYCNLHNLADASGINYQETIDKSACTQWQSANCDKY